MKATDGFHAVRWKVLECIQSPAHEARGSTEYLLHATLKG